MKPFLFRSIWAAIALAAALAAGCSTGGDVGVEAVAAARAKAQRDWKIQMDWAGGPVEAKLDRMDIYLVEDETQSPEIFEINGEDATLVGEFPIDLHVGYEAEYKRLIGKTVKILPRGGDPRDPKTSWVRLGDMRVPVSGGTFTIEKITGKFDGSEGDMTCWGTIDLRVSGADGEVSVSGKLAVNCVTWG
jgi:hypothetical protein